MMHLIEVCVCVCLHDNLITVADICFLIGSCVDWRKISDDFACHDKGHVIFIGFKLTW